MIGQSTTLAQMLRIAHGRGNDRLKVLLISGIEVELTMTDVTDHCLVAENNETAIVPLAAIAMIRWRPEDA